MWSDLVRLAIRISPTLSGYRPVGWFVGFPLIRDLSPIFCGRFRHPESPEDAT